MFVLAAAAADGGPRSFVDMPPAPDDDPFNRFAGDSESDEEDESATATTKKGYECSCKL